MRHLWARPAFVLLDEKGQEVGCIHRTDTRAPIVRLDLDPEPAPSPDGGRQGRDGLPRRVVQGT